MNALRGWAALRDPQEPSMRRPTEFPEFPSLENSPGAAGSPEDSGLELRLPREASGETRPKQKPVGRAFAMVAKRSAGSALTSECVKSNEGDEEIIKVYLRARAEHEEPLTQLKSEVRHIQEAGSALQKLREDLSTKLQPRPEFREFQEFQEFREFREIREFRESSEVVLEKRNGSCSCPQENPEDAEAPRFLQRLQEAEERLQLERKSFEGAEARLRARAEAAEAARGRAEAEAAQGQRQLRQLQGLLQDREKDHRELQVQLQAAQAELQRLREAEGERAAQQERSSQLEKEVATLREKIHHLDDMLKSQQRKVRQMIEQLQNSKSVVQAKEAAIQELQERVAYLEAENLEMHDRIEHLIEAQVSRAGAARARSKSECAGSKRLPGPKPLIRVVET